MVEIIEVHLWGRMIGVLAQQGSNISFSYDEEFQRSGIELSPLVMPLGKGVYSFPRLNPETFKGLPPPIADSLPDHYGTQLINRWLTMNGRPLHSITPLERLAYMGNRGMGAFEYHPSHHPNLEVAQKIEISSLVEMAKEILNQRNSLSISLDKDDHGKFEALRHLIQVGTSAGGARAKAVIAYNEETKEMRSGQTDAPNGFSQYLMKFDGFSGTGGDGSDNPHGFGAIEYVYHLMARRAGIEMMDCQIIKENGRKHFMTRRFDRVGIHKIHTQTLCAFANADYNAQRILGYENVFAILEDLNFSYKDKEQLFLRMLFNVMACNHDDHTKNFSFCMNKQGVWSISPAYDICYSYNPNRSSWVHQHQMTINNKAEHFELKDFEPIAKRFFIKKWKNLYESVRGSLKDWSDLAHEQRVEGEMVEEINNNFVLVHNPGTTK